MATAPSLIGASGSENDKTGTTETTGSLSWVSGDRVIVLGMTEDNGASLSTPTGLTNLTLAAISGSPTNTSSSCKGYAWTGVATGTGSGTFATTINNNSAGFIVAFVYRGSDGIGGTAFSATLGTTTTQSLVRAHDNSAVITIWGDWSAVNDVTVTWTPTGETVMEAQWHNGLFTGFCAHWGDQGAAGTTSYGFTAHAGGADMTAITIEVRGAAAGAGIAVPVLVRQFRQRWG